MTAFNVYLFLLFFFLYVIGYERSALDGLVEFGTIVPVFSALGKRAGRVQLDLAGQRYDRPVYLATADNPALQVSETAKKPQRRVTSSPADENGRDVPFGYCLPGRKRVVALEQLVRRFLVSELEPVARPHHDPMARSHQTK